MSLDYSVQVLQKSSLGELLGLKSGHFCGHKKAKTLICQCFDIYSASPRLDFTTVVRENIQDRVICVKTTFARDVLVKKQS